MFEQNVRLTRVLGKIQWLQSTNNDIFTFQLDPEIITEMKTQKLVDENGIVRSGTVYPSDDENAIGLIISDFNLNEMPGGGAIAVLMRGVIEETLLPRPLSPEAIASIRDGIFTRVKKWENAEIENGE